MSEQRLDLPPLEGCARLIGSYASVIPPRRQLLKRGEKGLIKSFKSRWFVYDDECGYLRYFKNKNERLSLGCVSRSSWAGLCSLSPSPEP